jgi:hypothetical protein
MAIDFWGRLRGGLANAVAKGNVYNRYTGQYAPGGVRAARFAAGAGSAVGGPAAIGTAIWKYQNDKTNAAQAWDASRTGWENINKQLSQAPDPNQMGLDVPDVGMGGYGGYSLNAPQQQMPTMPTVTAQAPQADNWNGGLGTANAFNSPLGSWANGQPQAHSYGQAAGSFTPWGAGVVQIAGNGWGGSDAAAGFGLGAQGAGSSSGGGYALSDAMSAARKNRS